MSLREKYSEGLGYLSQFSDSEKKFRRLIGYPTLRRKNSEGRLAIQLAEKKVLKVTRLGVSEKKIMKVTRLSASQRKKIPKGLLV